MIEIDLWQAIGLLITVLSAMAGLFWRVMGQYDARMAQRFQAMEEGHRQSSERWGKSFADVLERLNREADGVQRLEKDFLRWQAELPLQYVRREDYVRNQTVIEAKLDALASKLEVIQIKGKGAMHEH